VQRTKEGLESARARGRKGGRPRVRDSKIILQTGMIFVGRDALGAPGRRALRTAEIYDRFKYSKALKLYDSKEYSISEIVEMTGVSQATLYRYKNREPQKRDDQMKTAKINMYLRIENNNKLCVGKRSSKRKWNSI